MKTAGGAREGAALMSKDARETLSEAAGTSNPVAALGGCSQAALLLSLANIDADGNGKVTNEELQASSSLIEAYKDELLNAGVVAGLVLSALYEFAYAEDETLSRLHSLDGSDASWTVGEIADLMSMLANFLCVATCSVTILICATLYLHIAVWMPSIESQLWYVSRSSRIFAVVEAAKLVTLACGLLALACECAVTRSAWDILPFLPLLAAGAAVAYMDCTLARDCQAYLDSEIESKAWEGQTGGHQEGTRNMARDARSSLARALRDENPVAQLGGCGQTGLLLSLARLDPDGDGEVSEEDLDAVERLVSASKEALLNSGVVAAAMLATMFQWAYEEDASLTALHSSREWGVEEVADLTSCVADFVCVLTCVLVIVMSSLMYSQISLWMPSLEARLWYVNALSTARAAVDLATYVTVFSALLSLACQVAVTRSAWDILPFLPLLAVGLAMLYIQCTLSRDCKHYLTAELRLRPLGDGGALDA